MTSSPSAVHDLGLLPTESSTEKFKQIVSGETFYEEPYPYAQAYAGFQFGVWAGQLGDGRVINLFEATNDETGKRYEVQLKGGGLTPYSRFADGKAVLRSSIREFLGSEAAHALGIPTSRALAITSLPETEAVRERFESCAIVARMAESWVRLGTFNLARRQNRGKYVRQLADYVIDKVYGGVENLVEPHKAEDELKEEPADDAETSNEPSKTPSEEELKVLRESKYARLYREVVRRNAYLIGRCQAYGFLNGVLNTDNTSILGLSIDYGPFSFMDTFDPNYTPNHDDQQLRYSYKFVPQAMWWNLVKFGEDLGLYIGGGVHIDKPDFIDEEGYLNVKYAEDVQNNAVSIIRVAEQEYANVLQETLEECFKQRLGLTTVKPADKSEIVQPFLGFLSENGLDLNQSFRKLGDLTLFSDGQPSSTDGELDEATLISDLKEFYPSNKSTSSTVEKDESVKKFAEWVKKYRARLVEEGSVNDEERRTRMHSVNPKFVLKNWILDEVIDRVEKGQGLKDRRDDEYIEDGDAVKVLDDVLYMALHPFEESWGRNVVDEMRYTGEVPSRFRDSVCSCSS